MRIYRIAAPLLALLTSALPLQSALAQGFLEEVIVTAEKRETTLQDTAIAVSAFSQDDLERGLINNNMDVQFAVPNMLMSKGFFTTAQINIRGIGNLAIGASGDTGTGVHMNGVYLNNARIFETEYFDTERVEVLRGPQGTLYGRNTTAGVVNVITKKPEEEVGGFLDVSYGDYDYMRARGAVNFPVTDNLLQRLSVYYTERDGFVENIFDGNDVDGRDMYAVRSTTTLHINDNTEATLVVNYFEEDSSRMRGSGSYCRSDPDGILGCLPNHGGLSQNSNTGGTIAGFLLNSAYPSIYNAINAAIMGAVPGASLAVLGIPLPEFPDDFNTGATIPDDPRTVNFDFTPRYESEETIITLEINHSFDNGLNFTSVTGYHDSSLDARNDYDFTATEAVWPIETTYQRGPDGPLTVNRLSQNDRSTTSPEQFSQEFRLASDFDGPVNFLAGAFYLDYQTNTEYFVYSSALSAYADLAAELRNNPNAAAAIAGLTDAIEGILPTRDATIAQLEAGIAMVNAGIAQFPAGTPANTPQLVTLQTQLATLNGQLAQVRGATQAALDGLRSLDVQAGEALFHNDTHDYQLETWALFGELYLDLNAQTELTLGLRYTDETKEADLRTVYLAFVDRLTDPYRPVASESQETTGKVNLNYQLNDDILLYATASRSYKSGGFNPISSNNPLITSGQAQLTFEPEFINAFEIGAKTRLFDNTLQANLTLFIYDYKDLQVSKIVSQTAINENADAEIMGFEGEFTWAPDEHWQVSANLSWLDTEMGSLLSFDTSNPNQMGTTANTASTGRANTVTSADCRNAAGEAVATCDGLLVNVQGNSLPGAPEFSVFLSVRYGWFLNGGQRIDISASYYTQDEFYSRVFNTQDDKIDSWDIWNASAILSAADEAWYAEAWVRNIEDEDYVTGQNLQDPSVGLFRTYQLLEPRTYGLTLGYRF